MMIAMLSWNLIWMSIVTIVFLLGTGLSFHIAGRKVRAAHNKDDGFLNI